MAVWEEIVDYTTTTTNDVDFTNLNITKNDFIKFSISGEGSHLYPNDDISNSNYVVQTIVANGAITSSVSVERYTGNFIQISGGYSFRFGYIKLTENGNINYWFDEFDDGGSGISNFRGIIGHMTSTSTFNQINKFTFSDVEVGTRIQIYKLNAEKVADITVASNTNQVDITGLNITKDSEYLLVSDVVGQSISSADIGVYQNNDTNDGNYYTQQIVGSNATPLAESFTRNYAFSNTNNRISVSYGHIKLSNVGAYTLQSHEIRDSGGTSPIIGNYFISSTNENITSINQINIKHRGTNAIPSGSRFQLYKLY